MLSGEPTGPLNLDPTPVELNDLLQLVRSRALSADSAVADQSVDPARPANPDRLGSQRLDGRRNQDGNGGENSRDRGRSRDDRRNRGLRDGDAAKGRLLPRSEN